MLEKTLHIVIVGHVDHGKSTLVGRLFYDTGCLSPDKLEEIKKTSMSLGKELEFAYIMDHLEEEREKGITIDIAHTFFTTEKRRYVIIDAPGHKEFLKNMLSGSSQAEAALLLVDVARGVEEQTRRHCYLLSLIGIKQVVVLVNKMDMAGYSEKTFREIEKSVNSLLDQVNIKPTHILPISARLGENVAAKSEVISWFKGPTVLEALDSFESFEAGEGDLRFPVQDVYDLDGSRVAVGRAEAGVMKEGQEVFVLPAGKKGRVVEICKFMQPKMSEAPAGDCVGVRLDGCELGRGDILVNKINSAVTDTIRANIFWMVDKEYKLGIPVIWRCATQEIRGRIERICKRFDPASIEVVETDAVEIKPAEIADVVIKLEKAAVVDRFADIPEMGRFILEHGGHPVAGGIII